MQEYVSRSADLLYLVDSQVNLEGDRLKITRFGELTMSTS